jgi:phosphoribosylanthranilate isomerase
MFEIKICGITTPHDALLAAEAGADAIGLNFYEKSPRFAANPQSICAALPASMQRVGVFVNPSLPKLKQLLADTPLNAIQLHGDESVELFEAVTLLAKSVLYDRLTIIRAFRCQASSLQSLSPYLETLATKGCKPAALLIDAFDPNSYGGTGRTTDWSQLAARRNLFAGYPIILAGGLTPDNVAQAIATVRPDAVDVASGVESSPGKKDPAKLRDFIAAAKDAFAALD